MATKHSTSTPVTLTTEQIEALRARLYDLEGLCESIQTLSARLPNDVDAFDPQVVFAALGEKGYALTEELLGLLESYSPPAYLTGDATG